MADVQSLAAKDSLLYVDRQGRNLVLVGPAWVDSGCHWIFQQRDSCFKWLGNNF